MPKDWNPDEEENTKQELLRIAEKLADAMTESVEASADEMADAAGLGSLLGRQQAILSLAGHIFPFLDLTGVLDMVVTQHGGKKLLSVDPNMMRGEAAVLVAFAMEGNVRDRMRMEAAAERQRRSAGKRSEPLPGEEGSVLGPTPTDTDNDCAP